MVTYYVLLVIAVCILDIGYELTEKLNGICRVEWSGGLWAFVGFVIALILRGIFGI